MKTRNLLALLTLFLPLCLQGQTTSQQIVTAPAPGPGSKKDVFYLRQDMTMGRWWEDSEMAQKLQLTDNQVSQLNQIFTQHRLNLHGDLQDEQKANQALDSLLATEQPDEDQVNAQVDQVLTARNKLQREFTTMNVDFRKVLTLEQWKQLKALHQEKMRTMIKTFPGPGQPKGFIVHPHGPDGGPGPMLPPLPPPDGDF